MSLSDFLTHLVRFIFFVLGGIALANFLRYRDRVRLDIALMLGDLALIVAAQEYTFATGQNPAWLARATSVLLMALPYLMLRLVEHFRPVPAWIRVGAIVGLALSAVLLMALPTLPTPAALVLVVYFVLLEGYTAVTFVRGGLTTGGVTRRRMWLAAAGSGLIALVILLAGFSIFSQALGEALALTGQILGALSAIAYYFAFATPRWLRHYWQLSELHRFLQASARQSAEQRANQTLPFLCTMAVNAVGGRGAAAALWNEEQRQLVIAAATDPALTGTLSGDAGVTGRAWMTGSPAVGRQRSEFSPQGAQLSEALGSHSILAAPIATVERRWGLLAVFIQRGPLFPSDDMELLSLFTEQSALALDQTELMAEQHRLLEDLRQRTAQLEAVNRELEAFSYSVSHDLRAPLRHIAGFTDLLQRGTDETQRPRLLQRIAEASRRMGRLIDDLLEFSRLGRTELRRVPVPLGRLVEEARRDALTAEDVGGREIRWRIGDLPVVQGDPDLLRLVFTNLLSNAVKYSRPRNETQIEVGRLNGAASDGATETVIYVRDNGVGFDMRNIDKLFGVFQRLHHADEFEGVGIGLANVRRIILRHGGRAWAEGQLDKGATFYISLPALAPSSPVAETGIPQVGSN